MRLAKLTTFTIIETAMGLLRLLFWIAIIFAAIWLWRRLTRPNPSTNASPDSPLPMVRCAHCGVHIPQASALPQDQSWYCSQAHLEQGPSAHGR